MKAKLECPNCRVTIRLETSSYPSIKDEINFCPVCKNQDFALTIEEEKSKHDEAMERSGWMDIGGKWIRTSEWRLRAPKADDENLCEEFERFLRARND